jgi:hypothetical protein
MSLAWVDTDTRIGAGSLKLSSCSANKHWVTKVSVPINIIITTNWGALHFQTQH